MWYEILHRAKLSKVNIWSPWENENIDDLLAYVFQPPNLEHYEAQCMPLETLITSVLWNFSDKEIDTWMRHVGPTQILGGSYLTEKELESLHCIILGKGNSLTWDPVYGEPVFIEDHTLTSVLCPSRECKELVMEAILTSFAPNRDFTWLGSDMLQEAIEQREADRKNLLKVKDPPLDPQTSSILENERLRFQDQFFDLMNALSNQHGLQVGDPVTRVIEAPIF